MVNIRKLHIEVCNELFKVCDSHCCLFAFASSVFLERIHEESLLVPFLQYFTRGIEFQGQLRFVATIGTQRHKTTKEIRESLGSPVDKGRSQLGLRVPLALSLR